MNHSGLKITLIVVSIVSMLAFQGPEAGIGKDRIRVRQMPDGPVKAIPSLKTVPVPGPSEAVLSQFIRNKKAAIQLGKALFWDIQVSSDSKVSCGTCHFHAGADARFKNQLNPGVLANDKTFQLGGTNFVLSPKDFPLTRFRSKDSDRNDPKVSDSNDVVGSHGVFNSEFIAVSKTDGPDECMTIPDEVFHGEGFGGTNINTRRLEERNTPTVINAVFNFRSFFDGRANNVFNGVDPFGNRNKDAFVWKVEEGELKKVVIGIESSTLASQASGPPLSGLEMSCKGRQFHDLGRKLLNNKILQHQNISQTDSVLSIYATKRPLYVDLIKKAFHPDWWSGGIINKYARPDSMDLRDPPQFKMRNNGAITQMESNFALFFGLAIQLYESTLISDDSPFDRFAEGDVNALTESQKRGLEIFQTKGRCIECHAGAEFTNASYSKVNEFRLDDMEIEGERAIYDTGFNNTGVRTTHEDVAIGGVDKFNLPLSESRMVQKGLAYLLGGFDKSKEVKQEEIKRTSVDGAFKSPTLRNIELTGPYFHNGGKATLMEVIDFYNRGGDFFKENHFDMDEDVAPIGLSENEKKDLVAFLLSLTDDRVRFMKAPFDHPSLCFPHGHQEEEGLLIDDGTGNAVDTIECIEAVGAAGVTQRDQLKTFLNLDPFERAIREIWP